MQEKHYVRELYNFKRMKEKRGWLNGWLGNESPKPVPEGVNLLNNQPTAETERGAFIMAEDYSEKINV